MTRDELIAILAPLAVELAPAGRFEDEAEFNVYIKALEDLPAELIQMAADLASRTRKFMPKPSELRADAEAARRAICRAHQWTPCAQCIDSPMWVENAEGRMERCSCWRAHQEKLARLGLTGTTAAQVPALPPPREGAA